MNGRFDELKKLIWTMAFTEMTAEFDKVIQPKLDARVHRIKKSEGEICPEDFDRQ
jgi:hypothetical protein